MALFALSCPASHSNSPRIFTILRQCSSGGSGSSGGSVTPQWWWWQRQQPRWQWQLGSSGGSLAALAAWQHGSMAAWQHGGGGCGDGSTAAWRQRWRLVVAAVAALGGGSAARQWWQWRQWWQCASVTAVVAVVASR